MAIQWTEKDGKFIARDEYQPKTKEGAPLGGVQVAEATGDSREAALEALMDTKNTQYGNLYLSNRDLKTKAELAEKKSAPPVVEFKSRKFTEAEKLRIQKASGIDPEKADEVAELLFEAKFGVTPDIANADFNANRAREMANRNYQVSFAWASSHPEYNNQSDANNELMGKWMVANCGNEVTSENLDRAFAALSEVLEQPVPQAALPAGGTPATAGKQPDSPANGTDPSRITKAAYDAVEQPLATTVTRPEVSTFASVPSNQLTKVQIDLMSAAEYDKRMKDPAFVKRVNDLFARPTSNR